ncbi:MAG: MATE family efflux transporter [Sedimentisphaerales bacterium]|nr:MATE family efflux transporter [Sedimentisphaerales bacterium]
MIYRLQQRWQGEGGCGQVLRLALPLILSTSAHSIQLFVDRMFLSWHGAGSISASVIGGMLHFSFVSLFFGIVTYANTFVAQYYGAQRRERIGPSVWQAIWFAVLGGTLMLACIPLSNFLFGWVNHAPEIARQEIIYFNFLCLSDIPLLVCGALSTFFTGRGKTWTVCWVNLVGTLINIVLDYLLIFGHGGLPAWGIAGAAIATGIAQLTMMAVYVVLFFHPDYRRQYATASGIKLDWQLLKRMLRFGGPNGLHFMLDVSAFGLFLAFIGRIDKLALAATGIAFQINTLAFMPMFGFGTAVSTLVGQAQGAGKSDLASRSTWSATILTFTYMTAIAIGYWLLPSVFLYPFAANADVKEFAPIASIATILLRFVAFYCLFDTGNIIFASALKGAGDTRFVMWVSVILAWTLMVLPTWLIVRYKAGLYAAWISLSAYVCILAVAFLLRFLQGCWKAMRVIEYAPIAPPVGTPEMPTIEVDVT